jgi:hypothetical protein
VDCLNLAVKDFSLILFIELFRAAIVLRPASQPRLGLSVRCRSDRMFVRPGWNWRRLPSAFPAVPPVGPLDLTCRHDGRGRRPPPTQTQCAQVWTSWTSVRSSTKLPTSRNATFEQVHAPPLPWAGGNPNSTSASPSWLDHWPSHGGASGRESQQPLESPTGRPLSTRSRFATKLRCDHAGLLSRADRVLSHRTGDSVLLIQIE